MAAPARASSAVRLLLDEMHAPRIARILAGESFDVEAIASNTDLRGTSDSDLMELASGAGQVLVTENIVDFAQLAQQWASRGNPHAGLIFTNPKRFDRATIAYPDCLVVALRRFLQEPPIEGQSWIWWLDTQSESLG